MATAFDIGGLLGSAFGGTSALDDLLTEQQRNAIRQQGALSVAAALLQAAGPSTTRTSLGQALGSAFAAGQAGTQKAQESAITQMLTRQKLEEARREAEANKRYVEALQGLRTPTGEAATITPEQALAAPGMAVGPTVERAALVGQPAPTAAVAGRPAGLTDAQLSLLQTLPRKEGAAELLKLLTPKEQEVVGEPYRTASGQVRQRLKSGGSIAIPAAEAPELRLKPMGQPFEVTDDKGKSVLVQQFEDGTVQTLPGFGPRREVVLQTVDGKVQAIDKSKLAGGETFGTGRDVRAVDVGGQIRLVDFSTAAPGTALPKTLAPQVVGGAETGYFQIGGGGGRAPVAPAAGAAAPTAPAAGAAPAAPAAGPQPIIPGTGPKPTIEQDKSAGFALRMNQANQIFNRPIVDPVTNRPIVDSTGKPLTLEDAFGSPSRFQSIMRAIPSAGVTTAIANFFEGEGRQLYRQAQENWVRANLRAESGAVIGVDEMEKEIENYFPQANDKPATIRQKAEARRAAEIAMQVRAGPAYRSAQAATGARRGRLVTDPTTGVTRYVEE